MRGFRIARSAQADIVGILRWSDEQFGPVARARYEALITQAIRDAGSDAHRPGRTPRPELGDGVFTWHLAQSRNHVDVGVVRRPRHFLICRQDDDVLVIGRVLHDAMEPSRHLAASRAWQ